MVKSVINISLFVFSLIVFLFPQKPAMACSVCGSGDPLAAAGDSRPVTGQIRMALENQFLTASAASDEEPGHKEFLQQYTIKPVFVYSPLEFMNIVIGVPLIYKNSDLKEMASGATVDHNAPVGMGDIDIGSRLFIFQNVNLNDQMRHSLAITAGISTPTGKNNALNENNVRIDEHVQLGTGSWGPYLGLNYAFHKDPWNFSVYGATRIHSKNVYGYTYGTGILAGIGSQFRIWDPFALALGIDARYAFNDISNGELMIHTGGAVFNITPGFILNIVGDLWIKGNVQIPFYSKLSGDQSVGPTFSLNLEYAFHS